MKLVVAPLALAELLTLKLLTNPMPMAVKAQEQRGLICALGHFFVKRIGSPYRQRRLFDQPPSGGS